MKALHQTLVLTAIAVAGSMSSITFASDYSEYRDEVRRIMEQFGQTAAGSPQREECKRQLEEARDIYHRKLKTTKGFNIVGGAQIGGGFVGFHGYPDPAVSALTFSWFDTATSLPVTGPEATSVSYEVSSDWLQNSWSTLGSSTNASSAFDLNRVLDSSAIWIRAIPFDSAGQPILMMDGSDNVASGFAVIGTTVPEPSGVLLVLAGLNAVGVLGRNRHDRDIMAS